MDIVQEIVTPNSFDSISYPIKGFSDRLLERLFGNLAMSGAEEHRRQADDI
jgi:hypothetical protein